MAQARVKPKLIKGEEKQVHFNMAMDLYLEFEKIVYDKGFTVSEYLRRMATDIVKNGL